MNLKLDVPVGKYRELTSEELKELNSLLEDSTKTFKVQIAKKKLK
jgi:23S rRNA pseudouridine2604 synthase